jgi:CRISPR-associated exonuclease Cas4
VQNCNYCIVEYKPTKPKDKDYNYDDLMQVFAQKICVDYVFNCDCDAVIYYADVKKRIKLPLKENFITYDTDLKRIISEMSNYLEIGEIPKIRKSQMCNGCSMKDICMPSTKRIYSVKNNIKSLQEVDI